MLRFLLFLILILTGYWLHAQETDFISRGKIEYEIKVNQKRLFSDYERDHQMRDYINALPNEFISYYDLTFSWGSSLYSPGRTSPTPGQHDRGSVYMEKGKEQVKIRRWFFDKFFVYEDSVRPIKWKMQNETRKIAGFECRKAVGRLPYDVYVVAFYCPEFLPQSGPELFTGLPGMILGVAVPQWHTTWFATKIELASVDETKIAAPSPGKGKTYKIAELSEILSKDYKVYFGEKSSAQSAKLMFTEAFRL